MEEDEFSAAHYCTNKKCFAIERENIIHFVSKKGFNIEGLGEKIVEQLMNEGLVSNVSDIFELKKGDLEPLERFAEKSAQNIIDSIEKSKTITFEKFLYALGIHHVGEETAVLIGKHLRELVGVIGGFREIGKKFPGVSPEEWVKIKGIGEKSAESLHDWFNDKHNQKILQNMERLGVRVLFPGYKLQATSYKLQDMTFVITGELQNFTRDEAKDMIRKNGGDVSSSVSKKTSYVVVGENPGSKYDKAVELGVRVINEEEFKGLLDR